MCTHKYAHTCSHMRMSTVALGVQKRMSAPLEVELQQLRAHEVGSGKLSSLLQEW